MASSLGSPLSPFSAANIFLLVFTETDSICCSVFFCLRERYRGGFLYVKKMVYFLSLCKWVCKFNMFFSLLKQRYQKSEAKWSSFVLLWVSLLRFSVFYVCEREWVCVLNTNILSIYVGPTKALLVKEHCFSSHAPLASRGYYFRLV